MICNQNSRNLIYVQASKFVGKCQKLIYFLGSPYTCYALYDSLKHGSCLRRYEIPY